MIDGAVRKELLHEIARWHLGRFAWDGATEERSEFEPREKREATVEQNEGPGVCHADCESKKGTLGEERREARIEREERPREANT